MREFKKTPRPSTWRKIWNFLLNLFYSSGEASNSGGHHDRMQKRRRKTKFDRWS